jgi:tetratricopeptide (TPR) repeat protein
MRMFATVSVLSVATVIAMHCPAGVEAAVAVPVETQCARAAALADAGEEDAAKKIYVELATRGDAACATDALSKLNDESSGERVVSDVTGALKVLASGLVALLLAIVAIVVLFVLLTWTPLRRLLARLVVIGRLFDPTLKVEPFTDAGAKPPVGTGVTGLVRAALARLGEEQDQTTQLRIDSTAGVETIASAIGGLGDLVPQAKGVTGLLTALPALARTPRYSVDGTLQLAGEAGDGLTVSLKERGDLAATTTMWPPPATNESPDAYYQLASAASGWADFMVRQREDLPRAEFTSDAMSFGYFRAAVELDRSGRIEDAHDTYMEALNYDEENVGALLNLGLIYAREEEFERALVLFLRAVAIAERPRPGRGQ